MGFGWGTNKVVSVRQGLLRRFIPSYGASGVCWGGKPAWIVGGDGREHPRGTAARVADGGESRCEPLRKGRSRPLTEPMMKHLRPVVGFGAAGAQAAPSGVGTPRL